MRRALQLSIILLLSALAGYAQSPPGINYQGVARNPDGKPLALRDITIRINILKDGGNGEVEYAEVHSVKTNSFGLFTLVIGTGSVSAGDFKFISWAIGNKWLRVEMDPDGGNSFQLMGSQQFMSVPYAFYAKYSDNSLTPGQGISIANNVIENTGDADHNPANEYNTAISFGVDNKLRITDGGGTREADLTSLVHGDVIQDLRLTGNKLTVDNNPSATEIDLAPYLDDTDKQNLTLSGTTLAIGGGNSVNLSGINTDAQDLLLSGTTLSIGGGNSVNLASINAPQNLSLAGTNLAISGGNNIDLASLDKDQQNLTFAGTNLSISGGNSVNLASLAVDGQQLGLAGSTLSITGGNNVSLVPFLDNTDNQDLTLAGNTLSLTNDGTTVNLAPYLDNTDNQDLALSGNTLSLTNDASAINLAPYLDNTDNQDLSVSSAGINRMIGIAGGLGVSFSVADNDNDPVNEIQTLTYTPATKTLQISSGNSVNIPETQNISQVLVQGNDAGAQKITNLGAPTANTDAVTKQYVDVADAAITDRLNRNYAFKTNFAFSTLLSGGSNIPMPLSGESFDDYNVVNAASFTAQAAGFYIFTIDGSISSLLVGSSLSLLYNGTKYPVSVGSNNRFNTTLMFRVSAGETVSLVADGIGINTNINGAFFGYKLP